MYQNLRKAINEIRIIDDHGHPGMTEYYEGLPPQYRMAFATDTFKTPRESGGGFRYLEQLHYDAYEKFYGFSRADIDNPDKREELTKRYHEKRARLSELMDEVMDAAGVETFLVNFVMPDSIRNKENIRFIPMIDGLVFPFDNTDLRKRDLCNYVMGSFEYELKKYKKQYGYEEKDYENYLRFVDQVLEGFVKEGVVGFKFAIAYARTTYCEKVDPGLGKELYEKAKAGDAEAYHQLQDLLVWTVMRKITRLDMPVQFHFALLDNYIEYFDPLNLSNMLEDKELSGTKIVILHGGYPKFDQSENLALAGGFIPNNVYIDFSGRIMFANHPKIIAGMLRKWLEKPVLWDKLLYGSDMLFGERYIYTCAKTARDAVYIALESMIDDDIIDEPLAIVLAGKLLRDNAKKVYRL